MIKNKKIIIALSLSLVLSILLILPAFAGEDHFQYHLKLNTHQIPNYGTDARYRDSAHTDNAWSIELGFSTEGINTAATFWLASNDYNRKPLSYQQTVGQGTGTHYYKVRNEAHNNYVVLSVKNNHDSVYSYDVYGYWDEEVGYIPPVFG